MKAKVLVLVCVTVTGVCKRVRKRVCKGVCKGVRKGVRKVFARTRVQFRANAIVINKRNFKKYILKSC